MPQPVIIILNYTRKSHSHMTYTHHSLLFIFTISLTAFLSLQIWAGGGCWRLLWCNIPIRLECVHVLFSCKKNEYIHEWVLLWYLKNCERKMMYMKLEETFPLGFFVLSPFRRLALFFSSFECVIVRMDTNSSRHKKCRVRGRRRNEFEEKRAKWNVKTHKYKCIWSMIFVLLFLRCCKR